MGTEMVSSIVMYNFGVGPGGPYISANLEGHQSNLLFWGRAEAETKAKRGPTPKLYITLLLTVRPDHTQPRHRYSFLVLLSRYAPHD